MADHIASPPLLLALSSRLARRWTDLLELTLTRLTAYSKLPPPTALLAIVLYILKFSSEIRRFLFNNVV